MLIELLATLALAACPPIDDVAGAVQTVQGEESTTEFFGDGSYRVTRCDEAARPVRAVTMARIRTPAGTQPYVPVTEATPRRTVHLLYGDPADPVWAQAWREHGAQTMAGALAPDGPVPPASARPLAAPRDDSCTNGAYTTLGRLADRRYRYAADRRTVRLAFRRAVIRGHRGWDETRNGCGYRDQDNVASIYAGTVAASIHTVPDGRSVVDFGRLDGLCGGGTALACTWTFNAAITETDQRFARGFPWSTSGRAGTYDVESVATHESGHSIGLGHSSASPFLTMYPQICAGCTRARTLARGDVRGLRALYPGR